MRSFFVEGYGCSLNISETESVAGFLRKSGFEQVSDFASADFVIINTCSVKQVTEQRMLSRISFLFQKKKLGAKLIVVGCLAAAQGGTVSKINKEIIVLDTKLSSLCRALGLPVKDFSPEIIPIKSHELISIIPISTGCLGNCAYCSARIARKNLVSYSQESICKAVENALSVSMSSSASREIWLTSQDLGCYGFDINSSLPNLLKEILKIKGDFRIRLGMMNPNHFIKIKEDLMPLFADKRLYKFLHLPLQSGSDKILSLMNRKYSVKDFVGCVDYARLQVSEITIATDIIAGFAGESEADFKKTLSILKKIKPDVVNISRFGKRVGTLAQKMSDQVSEQVKKDRSRVLTKLCDSIFEKKNKNVVGACFECLVSERANNGFNARTNSYSTVFVKSGFGEFVLVRITQLRKHYLVGDVVKKCGK